MDQERKTMTGSEVATTGSDGATKPRRQPAVTAAGPPSLTAQHRLLIEYMTAGCYVPGLLVKIRRPAVTDPDTGEVLKPVRNPEAGVPLTVEEAAELVGLRRRTARLLIASPIGMKAMAAAVSAMRDGAKAAAMRKVIDLVHIEGEGKAADRKVQLEAARDILGLKESGGVTVNVGIQSNTTITPGLVLRDPRPATQTIEHTDTQSSGGTVQWSAGQSDDAGEV